MEETLSKAAEFAFLGVNKRSRRLQTIIQVWWYPPPEIWFKLNIDDSLSGNPSRVEGGGIIRNSHGEWVSGYARATRHTTSVVTELWALRDGINLCIDLNLTNVIIELDAKLVMDLLQNEEGRKNGNEVIIADCREGLKKIPRVRVQHCFREANMCVDALTRRGTFLFQDFVIFHSPHLMFLFWLVLMLLGLCMSEHTLFFMFLSEWSSPVYQKKNLFTIKCKK